MGLFSKKDKVCAICGEKVKGLFPSKIDGEYICSTCYGVVDLPNGYINNMTVDEFRGYMSFREKNQLLRERFQVTQKIDFGWLDTKFMFDMTNHLLCMDKNLDKTIFEGKQIKSFVIREDSAPLFEGNASGLRIFTSTVPERTMALAPQINHIRMQIEMQRNAERMANRQDNAPDNNQQRPQMPRFDIPEPFQNFNVDIAFDHPYWYSFTADMGGPRFNNNYPDVNDYLRDYRNKVVVMEELAQALMSLAFPGAPTAVNGGYSTPMNHTDPVAEIQRFKALMDQGIITEEEFTAKKKQLLGL